MNIQIHNASVSGLKYAVYALGASVIVIIAVSFLQNTQTEQLTGRALNAQEKGEIPRVSFTPEQTWEGFTAPASTHVIFTMPEGVRVTATTVFGGNETSKTIRYWYYCFSGNEKANQAAGKKGRDLYDGYTGYSKAEREAMRVKAPANDDLLGILEYEESEPDASELIVFTGGESCYVMSQHPIPVGIDEDDDLLNSALERIHITDPRNGDTDRDTIEDGKEVNSTKTDPTSPDTDRDGLGDQLEDKDMDGRMDGDETSPVLWDTDRDGLCDGSGLGTGCKEPRSYPFRGEDTNQNGIVDAGETDPKLKDTDSDGKLDIDEKWDIFQPVNLAK